MLPQLRAVQAAHAAEEVTRTAVRLRVIADTAAIGDPGVRDRADAPQLQAPVLNVSVAALSLLDGLLQPWVRHAVEDVPHRLRMILREYADDLQVEHLDLRPRTPGALYRTCTINAAHRRPCAAHSCVTSCHADRSLASASPICVSSNFCPLASQASNSAQSSSSIGATIRSAIGQPSTSRGVRCSI